MAKIYLLSICILTIMSQIECFAMFDWFWRQPSGDTMVLVADGVPLVSIPYESMTEDEKFLQEAAKFSEIQIASPLETCQHKVVMKIKTSCTAMSEEDLAKLSVNLLNCQSAVEGRKMFPCTEEMSLKQCTTDMDADMWNAYHLMSNRARAVCYAARSTQFRALTELTVNKLMQSAHSQIKALNTLKEGQDRLEEQTIEALSTVHEGNKVLLQQQQYMRDAQASAQKLVSMNLRELTNEKALIRAGHAQLAAMAEDIKKKLEKASEDLAQQAIESSVNHKEVLDDLIKIQEQTQIIWEKIVSSTDRIMELHEDAMEQTLQKLIQINDTIQFIWNITNAMRAEMDDKLGWITAYIGDTGEQLQRVYRISLHIIYLLVAMIIAAFLHAPFLTRAAIMGIVPVNLMTYLKHGMDACLDFTSITFLIFLITGMHFLMVGIQYMFGPKVNKSAYSQVKVINQNRSVNGNVAAYKSSSYESKESKESLYSKLKTGLQSIRHTITSEINRCTERVVSLIQSVLSWSRQSLSQREELSCSYMPSKKSREDVLYDYDTQFMNMSEDRSPYNSIRESPGGFDETDDLIDANELRQRLARNNNSVDKDHHPSSRSTTPSSGQRPLCIAVTRNGRRCRLVAGHGQYYCFRHGDGSSIIGD